MVILGKRGSILIVDDMAVNRAILKELFEYEFDTLEAENGKEALEQLEQHREEIKVILLDIVMPVMDGFEVLEYLVSYGILREIPVIMITGENTVESEQRGYDMGVSDIIGKPFDPYIVLRRVENIIDLYSYKNHLESMLQEKTIELQKRNEELENRVKELEEELDRRNQ